MAASVKPAPAEIASDAHWFPATLDLQRGAVGFVRTDRQELAGQGFLDDRWQRAQPDVQWLGFDEIEMPKPEASTPPRLNFIWHTAFCSSTAISRMLDVPGRNLGLREPEALTLLADLKRANRGALPAHVAHALFALFARRFDAHEAITLKPSNAANYILGEAASLTSGRWLMLYSDCTSFLTAVMRRGEQRRAHVRRVFEKIAGDNAADRRWPVENYFALTDLQIAAFCWHLQIAELRRAMATLARDRVASLDCDAFLDDPRRALSEIDRFLGLGIGTDAIAGTVAGQLMKRDAKAPGAQFEISERKAEWERLAPGARNDIQTAVAWASDAFKVKAGEPPLPSPLVPIEKDYGAKR